MKQYGNPAKQAQASEAEEQRRVDAALRARVRETSPTELDTVVRGATKQAIAEITTALRRLRIIQAEAPSTAFIDETIVGFQCAGFFLIEAQDVQYDRPLLREEVGKE